MRLKRDGVMNRLVRADRRVLGLRMMQIEATAGEEQQGHRKQYELHGTLLFVRRKIFIRDDYVAALLELGLLCVGPDLNINRRIPPGPGLFSRRIASRRRPRARIFR